MKAIIYYRKSTDRDDMQANSLEHQLVNCRRIASVNNFDVIEEIGESKSAKTEWTRAWFNKLIKVCKTWKIDYIVIDEPKRLSRNNLDSARIIDLFDKKQIKWIYSTGRIYLAEQINDVFLLQLDLSLSKMDNAHRSKDVKEKMESCINNTRRFLWKAPFWYKNITIKKWHKDIMVDEKEAKIVKEIYNLRLENKSYPKIAKIMKSKYEWKIQLDFTSSRIHRLVRNKFYYGIFIWNKKEYIWNHKPLITKEVYDIAKAVWVWVYECQKDSNTKTFTPREYYFKGFVKDSFGYRLTAYEKKWFTYYSHQGKSPDHISINENLLFDWLWKLIQELDHSYDTWEWFNRQLIDHIMKKSKFEYVNEVKDLDKKILSLKVKQEKLLDMKLDEVIDETTYLLKHNHLENEIRDFLDQKAKLKNNNFSMKTQLLLELAWSLYKSYSVSNQSGKMYIIRQLMLELVVNNKKELQIAESPLFEVLKILNFMFGTPKNFDIRTYKEKLSIIDLVTLKEFCEFIKLLNK